jgi:TolB protein
MNRLDRSALFVILLAGVLLAGLIASQHLIPVQVTCANQPNCRTMSPYGSLAFEFSRSVIQKEVERAFITEPSTPGTWVWRDDRHGTWYAQTALKVKQSLTFYFREDLIGKNGERLASNNRWQSFVRMPAVAYLSMGETQEIYKVDPFDPSKVVQLTDTGGRINDYQPSPDGEKIVYSVFNDQGGIDLWIMNREGKEQRLLVDCGADYCTTPAWSLLTSELWYTREKAPVSFSSPRGSPRIWFLNMQNGMTQPLYADSQKIGYGPNPSPDGRWIAAWNGAEGGIEVVDRENNESFLIKNSSGDIGVWTQDSRAIYFEDVIQGEISFRNVIMKADMATQQVAITAGGNLDTSGNNYHSPIWNPAGTGFAVTTQPNLQIPGGEIWLMSPGGEKIKVIYSDFSKVTSFTGWTPGGEFLLFKVFTLSAGADKGIIAIWNLDEKGGVTELVNGANFPKWLP